MNFNPDVPLNQSERTESKPPKALTLQEAREKHKQQWLVEANLGNSPEHWFERFQSAKSWYEQAYIIEHAGGRPDASSLSFLKKVVDDFDVTTIDDPELEYGDIEYNTPAHEATVERVVETFWRMNDLENNEWVPDYKEWLMDHIAKQLQYFDTSQELKSGAESILFNLLKKTQDLSQLLDRIMLEQNGGEVNNIPREADDEDEELLGNYSEKGIYGLPDDYSETLSQTAYSFKNTFESIIRALGRVGSVQSIDVLVDFMKNNQVLYSRAVAQAVSNINPVVSAQKLLPILRDPAYSKRRDAAEALRLLEFGHVEISGAGVEYLGTTYDLTRLNTPSYFAQRVSDQGEVGIFDDKQKALNYFELNLEAEAAVVRPEIRDFTVDTLFPYKKDETKQAVQDKAALVSEFTERYQELLNHRAFSGTGVYLNNNTLREQLGFFQYYKSHYQTAGEQEQWRFKQFLLRYGDTGFRTFLACIENPDYGQAILELDERLPTSAAERVFTKFNEITDVSERTREILADILSDDTMQNSQSEIDTIREHLMERAKNLLTTFITQRQSTPDVIKALERYKTEILLYADTYKKLKESGRDITLESFKETEITILSQEEKAALAEELWDITKANRPFITDADKIQKREAEFRKTIDNLHSQFFVLRHKGEVVAFCSATIDAHGDVYLESLNVESEIKGEKIGSEFFPAVVERLLGAGKALYGYVHEKNSGMLPYYERIGFHIKEVEVDGEKKYEIRIPAMSTEATQAQ